MEREIEIGRGADLMSVCKAFGVGRAGLEELTQVNLDRLRRTPIGVGSFEVDVAEGDTIRIPKSWPTMAQARAREVGVGLLPMDPSRRSSPPRPAVLDYNITKIVASGQNVTVRASSGGSPWTLYATPDTAWSGMMLASRHNSPGISAAITPDQRLIVSGSVVPAITTSPWWFAGGYGSPDIAVATELGTTAYFQNPIDQGMFEIYDISLHDVLANAAQGRMGQVGTVWDPTAIDQQFFSFLNQLYPPGSQPLIPPGFNSPGIEWLNAIGKTASSWFNQTNPGATPSLDQAKAFLQGAITWLASYGPGGAVQWPVDPAGPLSPLTALTPAVQAALDYFTKVVQAPPAALPTPPAGVDPGLWLSNVTKTAATWWALVQQNLPAHLATPPDAATALQWIQAAGAFVKSYLPGVPMTPGPLPVEKGGGATTTPVTVEPAPPKTLDCGDPKLFHYEQGMNAGKGGCAPNTGVATVTTPPAPVPTTPGTTVTGKAPAAPPASNTGLIIGVVAALGLGALLLSTMGRSAPTATSPASERVVQVRRPAAGRRMRQLGYLAPFSATETRVPSEEAP